MFNTLVSKTIFVVACAVLLCACEQGPNTGRGFQLPEGDIAMGQQSFVELGCHQCHSVTGVELPAYGVASPLTVEIGGEVIRVKTYAELLTSIVNPQHVIAQQYLSILDVEDRKDAESLMPSFNKRMTVDQLVNIVTFLNSHYEKVNPEYIGYYY